MDRVAVFVDAGYLFAQGSLELCGRKLERRHVSLDHRALIDALKEFAERTSGLPLLRIYWYDGTSQGPTSQHNTLADQADMKVRLGFVNTAGQQKGVDSLVVTDMITLARNRAMAECIHLSGDEDIRVGVQQAQEYGVRVHLLGIRPARGSQSLFLRREADSSHEWNADDLRVFLECSPMAVGRSAHTEDELEVSAFEGSHPAEAGFSKALTQPDHDERLRQVAEHSAGEVPFADIPALVNQIRSTNQRPPQIDGKLLAMSRRALGGCDLDSTQKQEVRAAFLDALEKRLGEDEKETTDESS